MPIPFIRRTFPLAISKITLAITICQHYKQDDKQDSCKPAEFKRQAEPAENGIILFLFCIIDIEGKL